MNHMECIAPMVKLNFKTSIFSSIYVIVNYIYSKGYILVIVTIAVGENKDIQVVFKNCAPFTNYIIKINNPQTYDVLICHCIIS